MPTFKHFLSGVAGRRDGAGLSSLARSCCLALPLLLAGGFAQAQTFSDGFAQGAAGSASIVATTTDSAGNSYAIGNFSSAGGALTGAGMSLTAIGTYDGFIAKFNASGAVVWAHNFGGTGASVNVGGLALDPSGNIYVGASFSGANLTAPAVTKISSNSSVGYADGLVMKFDTNGNLYWVRNFGGTTAQVQQNNLAVDSSGSLVAVGNFRSGNLTAPALTKQSTINGDAYAMKIDTNGNLVWVQDYGSAAAATFGESVAIDSAQNVYVTGQFSMGNLNAPALTRIGTADTYVIKLNSSGATQWAHNYGGAGVTTNPGSAAIDSSGNLAVSGYFLKGSMSTPYLPMVSSTDPVDAYVFKISSAGATMWSHAFGGPNAGTSSDGVFADNAGNIVVTGIFQGTSIAYPAMTAAGYNDIFAVEMNASGTPTWALNVGAANDYVQGSATGNYFANGTRYMLLGGEIHSSTTTNWSPFLMKTPIQ